MIRNSRTFATIGALAVLTLRLSIGQAASEPVSASAQDDGVIQEQVYDALNTDPMYFFRHVDVQVQHGVVTLTGYVWSVPSIYRAENIAARVPGVTRVVDRMELQRNGLTPHA